MKPRYIIDANAFIKPYREYYAFDLAPGYWENLLALMSDGCIVTIDKVMDEICIAKESDKKDELQLWTESNIPAGAIIKTFVDPAIVAEYANVINYIHESQLYTEVALRNWSNGTTADPWLIATAKAYNLRLVSFEKPNTGLSRNTPSKNAKIPDVSSNCGVNCCSLFDMMRSCKLSL